jgi:hypothetical protein
LNFKLDQMSSISTGFLIRKRCFRASAVPLTCLITAYLLWQWLFNIPNAIDISTVFMPGSTQSLFFTTTPPPNEPNSKCSSKVLEALTNIEITVTKIKESSPNLDSKDLPDMVVKFKLHSPTSGWFGSSFFETESYVAYSFDDNRMAVSRYKTIFNLQVVYY